LPPFVEAAELYGVAGVALCEAALSYREGTGASFKTWVACKARGAVLDYLRREDREVGRAVRERLKAGMPVDPQYLWCKPALRGPAADSAMSAISTPPTQHDGVVLKQLREAVSAAMREMTSQERIVLSARFWDDATLAQAGKLIGKTEVRALQVQRKALGKLSECLREFLDAA